MIKDYIAIDVETTGLNSKYNRLIEIAAIKVNNFEITDTFTTLINPEIAIPDEISRLTGIKNSMLSNSPYICDIIENVAEFCEGYVLLGHNLIFDFGFIKQNCINHKLTFEKHGIDTLKIARKMLPEIEKRSLEYLCRYYKIEQHKHHRAYDDAYVTHILYQNLLDDFVLTNKEIFSPCPLQYHVKKICPITNRQKDYLNDLIKYHKINFKIEVNDLSKNEASRLIDKIILKHGRIV